MRVTMEQGQTQLPGNLPNFLLTKILPLTFLLIDHGLHVTLLSELHGYIETARRVLTTLLFYLHELKLLLIILIPAFNGSIVELLFIGRACFI